MPITFQYAPRLDVVAQAAQLGGYGKRREREAEYGRRDRKFYDQLQEQEERQLRDLAFREDLARFQQTGQERMALFNRQAGLERMGYGAQLNMLQQAQQNQAAMQRAQMQAGLQAQLQQQQLEAQQQAQREQQLWNLNFKEFELTAAQTRRQQEIDTAWDRLNGARESGQVTDEEFQGFAHQLRQRDLGLREDVFEMDRRIPSFEEEFQQSKVWEQIPGTNHQVLIARNRNGQGFQTLWQPPTSAFAQPKPEPPPRPSPMQQLGPTDISRMRSDAIQRLTTTTPAGQVIPPPNEAVDNWVNASLRKAYELNPPEYGQQMDLDAMFPQVPVPQQQQQGRRQGDAVTRALNSAIPFIVQATGLDRDQVLSQPPALVLEMIESTLREMRDEFGAIGNMPTKMRFKAQLLSQAHDIIYQIIAP